jgi:NitT/TauT family transport system substrate-binding protein
MKLAKEQRRAMARRAVCALVGAVVALVVAPPLRAEANELRISRSSGIGYLQIMVMEHERLIEKETAARGLGEVNVHWTAFADALGSTNALLAGKVDIVAGGLGSFVTLWERTQGTIGVKGIAALDSMPMLLVTRNPDVKSLRDLGAQHRIAVPGVKVSSQATTLQYAAAQAYGAAEWARLDNLTVNLGHPTAVQLLQQEGSGITAHFASPPYQYVELRDPSMHTILNSYDVWGGPQTFALVWTTTPFRAQNPNLYAAFYAALGKATEFIRRRPLQAAAIYVAMSRETNATAGEIAKMLEDPQIRFTLTPQNVAKFAAFKVDTGALGANPRRWQDLFFPEVHGLPGS